jgi:hypothetical protein
MEDLVGELRSFERSSGAAGCVRKALAVVHAVLLSWLEAFQSARRPCDCCVRLDLELLRPDEETRAQRTAEKEMHLDAAITQRRAISNAVRVMAGKLAPSQTLPEVIIADVLDDEIVEEEAQESIARRRWREYCRESRASVCHV